MEGLDKLMRENKVLIFGKTGCQDTEDVVRTFKSLNVKFKTVLLDTVIHREALEKEIYHKAKKKITPAVFINGWQLIGKRMFNRYLEDGTLQEMLDGSYKGYDYDLLVIGGGSGGIAAAREAGRFGALVCLCDFVEPTPHGTTWGLGGTCINVGCVPKKLMHMAAIIGSDLEHASCYGWNTGVKPFHNWNTLITEVQNHIKSLNFGNRKVLKESGVMYINASAQFVDVRTVRTLDRRGEEKMIKAKEFIIATGGRPRYLEIPGANYAITSDDLFSLPYHPGKKVLIVGASYVALECAGILISLGIGTTVLARDKILGRFDQQMAQLIAKHMTHLGVKFIRNAGVECIEEIKRGEPGTYEVTLKDIQDGKVMKEKYNTILLAIGRQPNTKDLGLQKAGVNISPDKGLILVNEKDQTSASHIYAVGDVCQGRTHLTPVAVQLGKLLARRLFGNQDTLTDHNLIPSTLFSTLEYGFVGLAEEEAVKRYGASDVKVFHANYIPPGYCQVPLGQCLEKRFDMCYAKIICISSAKERVVGLHICGPYAGEITQGFALALKAGAKKDDFLNMFSVHHTSASVFTNMYNSKTLAVAKGKKHKSSKK